jgi:hypothetical protein
MARIRSIHPGFFTDEAVVELSVKCPLAIVLLLGLWCESDDGGAFKWTPLALKARYLGATAADGNELLEELAALNCIRRFDIEGRAVGVVRNFARFQRPQKPEIRLPFTPESRAYAGFDAEAKRGNGQDEDPSPFATDPGAVQERYDSGTVAVQERYDTATVPVQDHSATATGNSQQKEEEGRRKELHHPSTPGPQANAREGAKPFAELTGAKVIPIRTEASLEADARALMGGAKVARDPDFSPIAGVLGEPGVTRADVVTALTEARARRFPPKTWGACVNWVRAAAQDRIAAEAQAAGVKARDGPNGGHRPISSRQAPGGIVAALDTIINKLEDRGSGADPALFPLLAFDRGEGGEASDVLLPQGRCG